MSLFKSEDSSKWINFIIAIGAILFGMTFQKSFIFLAEKFDIESKISNLHFYQQGLSILVGAAFFLIIYRNKPSMKYLNEVYTELLKVVWPDNQSTVRLTGIIVVAVIILSIFFSIIDYIIIKFFDLFYTL